MDIQFDKISDKDYDEALDLINYVFSYSNSPHDFKELLPKLYKPEYFKDNIHYVAREDKKIKALVGAIPTQMELLNSNSNEITKLPGRGIGMVSVHPYSRSKGYMNTLMKMAMDDMKKDGILWAFLAGQRQRYEYSGFTHGGCTISFCCTETNINHTLGRKWSTDLSLEKMESANEAFLDQIFAIHETKKIRIQRSRNKLFDILSSWKAETFVITKDGNFFGYFVIRGNSITEIYLKDFSKVLEVLGLFFRYQKKKGAPDYSIISVGSHELEKITIFSAFAENYTQNHLTCLAVLDFIGLTDKLLKYKAASGKITEGSFLLQIQGNEKPCNLRLFVGNNGAGAEETDEPPKLVLNNLETTRFLFSPWAEKVFPAIRESVFLQNILPLPLFLENADDV